MTVYKIYELTVDTMDERRKQQKSIVFNQNDLNTAKLVITVHHNGEVLDLTDSSVKIAFLKPDKKRVYQECTVVDPENGVVEVVLHTQALAVAGAVQGELLIDLPDDYSLGSVQFFINVRGSIMSDGAIESTNEYSIIQKAIDAGEILSEIDDLETIVENTTNVNNMKEEIETARGTETDLNSRFSTIETELESVSEQISNLADEAVTIDDTATDDTEKTWSASKLNTEIVNINSELESTNELLAQTEQQKADKSHIWNMANMGQDIKEAMTGGSVAVVGKNAVLRENIVENQIDYSKTDFLELDPTINLYNNKDYILGAKIQPITGGNGFFKTSDGSGKIAYLRIKPNTEYTIKKEENTLSNGTQFKYATASFLYDIEEGNKLLDGLYVVRNNSTYATFTTTETDQYLYIYFDDDINGQNYIQVLEGTNNEFVAKQIAINPTSTLNIYSKNDLKNVKTIEKNADVSRNLFNRNLPMMMGYAVLADGTISQNSDYNVSGKHYFEKGKTYIADSIGSSFTGFNAISFYDEQDNFLKRVSISSGSPTFTVPYDAEYGRFNVGRNEYNARVNEGTELLPYEPYGVSIESDKQKAFVESVLESNRLLNKKHVKPPFELNEWFEKLTAEPFNSMDGVTYDQVYQFYDDLVAAAPDYVTKTLLGNDQSGTYPIYSYVFSPTRPRYEVAGVHSFDAKLPKVIITTALHGSEKPAILTLMNIMQDITENWQTNKTLEWLRFNVEFIIVPLVNPWGFVNNTRGNVNHVDINRNFDYLWEKQGSTDPSDDRYRGTAPNSEKETQYLKSILESNADALFYYDFHTLGSGAATWDKLYRFEISDLLDVYPISQVAEYVTTKTMISGQKNHNVPLDSGHLGVVSIGTVTASAYNYANKIGILGCAPEVAYNYVGGNTYTDDINKLNTEYMLNSVTMALKELL